MSDFTDYAITASIGAALNVALSLGLKGMATEEEKKPKGGAASLDMKGQFMHMMVHHSQTLVVSSLIVFVVVFLSAMIKDRFVN